MSTRARDLTPPQQPPQAWKPRAEAARALLAMAAQVKLEAEQTQARAGELATDLRLIARWLTRPTKAHHR